MPCFMYRILVASFADGTGKGRRGFGFVALVWGSRSRTIWWGYATHQVWYMYVPDIARHGRSMASRLRVV